MRTEPKLSFSAQPGGWRNPRTWAPVLVGALAVLNLAAGWFFWQTPGGSSDDLAAQVDSLRAQVQRSASELTRLRALVKKVETARNEQDQFVYRYFLDRRTASSAILTELGDAASQAGLSPREHAFSFDPVEGSDVFSLMTIAANYEGRYNDLRKFISALDRSERFLIIEEITAAPQQEPGKLTARFRISAFVREGAPASILSPGAPPVAPSGVPQPAPPAPQQTAPAARIQMPQGDDRLKLAERTR